MRERRVVLLLALLASVCVASFMLLFERYQHSVDQGLGVEAQRNPWLAATLFLRRSGQAVQTRTSWEGIDSVDPASTLFVVDSRLVLSGKQARQLDRWLRRGGHLIVGAAQSDDVVTDPLLQRFNVSSVPVHDEKTGHKIKPMSEQLREWNAALDDHGRPVNKKAERTIPAGEITTLTFADVEQPLQLHFSPYPHRVLRRRCPRRRLL